MVALNANAVAATTTTTNTTNNTTTTTNTATMSTMSTNAAGGASGGTILYRNSAGRLNDAAWQQRINRAFEAALHRYVPTCVRYQRVYGTNVCTVPTCVRYR